MGRDLRYIPPNSLQHVVDVTTQSRYLLRPSTLVNRRFLGVLGRAQAKYDMVICGVVVLSNHFHLLLRPRDGQHLANFMCFLKANIAKEIGTRLRGWRGPFFRKRYHSTTVSDEDAAQIQVLRYVLSNGVKEFLVDRVREWPGVHCAASLADGTPLVGSWYDRSAEYEARNRNPGCEIDEEEFATDQSVELSPLPCWEHLEDSSWRRFASELIEEIDQQVATERTVRGRFSLGVAGVLNQDSWQIPEQVDNSPTPRFHAIDRQVLKSMMAIWREVMRLYNAAAEALRDGVQKVIFPPGTFPPGLPFIPFSRSEALAIASRGQPG